MTPCKFGSDCDDAKCIYGHRCPNDVEGNVYSRVALPLFVKVYANISVGRKDCRWGENCRFERELHGLDRAVVKTLKVGK